MVVPGYTEVQRGCLIAGACCNGARALQGVAVNESTFPAGLTVLTAVLLLAEFLCLYSYAYSSFHYECISVGYFRA